MVREKLIRRFAFAATLGLSACSVDIPFTNGSSKTTSTTIESRINLSSLPSNLPGPVAEKIASVVDIGVQNPRFPSKASVASGVKTEDGVLTAGHTLYDGKLLGFTCGDLKIVGRSEYNNTPVSNVVSQAKTIFDAFKSTTDDISLLRVKNSEAFSELPDSQISKVPPNVGDFVYFINFQQSRSVQSSDGTVERDPERASKMGPDDPFVFPAIYLGVIVGYGKGATEGKLAVLTNLRSYTTGVPETISEPGSSGGPLYDKNGNIIGIVSSGYGYRFSQKNIKSDYNVVIEGIPETSTSNFEISFVQPLSRDLVNQLQDGLENNPENCIPTPPRG